MPNIFACLKYLSIDLPKYFFTKEYCKPYLQNSVGWSRKYSCQELHIHVVRSIDLSTVLMWLIRAS